jgi:CBS domain-containing protein
MDEHDFDVGFDSPDGNGAAAAESDSYREVNMRVSDVMTRHVITVPVDATIAEAAELMKNHDIGFLPVVADDILVGVLTDRDLVVRGMCGRANPYLTPVRSIMSTRSIWCYEHDVLTDAAEILAENQVHRLIVVDSNKKLVGLLSIDDLASKMNSDRLLGDLLRHVSAA